jgi:hypothetical protein
MAKKTRSPRGTSKRRIDIKRINPADLGIVIGGSGTPNPVPRIVAPAEPTVPIPPAAGLPRNPGVIVPR